MGWNHLKGMDVYLKLDELLDQSKMEKFFEFTFIGNIPGNHRFKNITHIKPLEGHKLAEKNKNESCLFNSINK